MPDAKITRTDNVERMCAEN